MQRLAILIGLTGVFGLLTACPPTYPKCSSDEHCKAQGEVCVQGQCQECATDANCKEGFVCQDSRCVPKPECSSDGDCGAGRRCLGGRCLEQESRAEGTCTTNEDCPSGQECEAGYCVTRSAARCDWTPVRFGFNDATLSPEAQQVLSSIAECIRSEGARLVLEGHADERGTEEYNLQLSNRRAGAVKRYLTQLGVAAASLDTVGFGENRPAMSGSNEDAWAANRRVEFNRR